MANMFSLMVVEPLNLPVEKKKSDLTKVRRVPKATAALVSLVDENDRDRRLRILDAAEELFAQQSYEAVTIRNIAAKALVNSALVRYYFGVKEQLYLAIFEARYQRITETRQARFAQLDLKAGDFDSLVQVIDAWVSPLAELAADPKSRNLVRLLAQEIGNTDSDQHGVFVRHIDPAAKSCLVMFEKVYPEASKADLVQCYQWMVSIVLSTITSGRGRAKRLLGYSVAPKPDLNKMITFIANGFAAAIA
jgi:AcrR family transcriptional regulator